MSDSNNLHHAPFYIINDCLFSTDGFWLWPGLIHASSYKVSIINFPIYDQLLECMVHYTQQGLRQALWIYYTEQMVSKLLALHDAMLQPLVAPDARRFLVPVMEGDHFAPVPQTNRVCWSSSL